MKQLALAALLLFTTVRCSGAQTADEQSPTPQQEETAPADSTAPATAASETCDGPLSAERNESAALERLWRSEELCPGWLAGPLADALPPQWEGLRSNLTEQLGELRAVEPQEGGLNALFERGRVTFRVHLDEEGRLIGLWFDSPELGAESPEELLALFRELPGEVSVLVRSDGESRAELNADQPLDVGSAFKLAVLAALVDAVEAGQGDWRDGWSRVVELDDGWRSLPSGHLQNWPAGAPITVHSLAALMISISDNTATDAVMNLLGAEAIERHSGAVRPVPTTRQRFQLHVADAEVQQRYAAGDEAARREILASLADTGLPDADAVGRAGSHPELGWHFTAEQLCDLLQQLHEEEVLRINPGPIDPAPWEWVAYKGGGAQGVLNFSGLVGGEDGREHCVVATWNNRESIDQRRFATLYNSLLATLD